MSASASPSHQRALDSWSRHLAAPIEGPEELRSRLAEGALSRCFAATAAEAGARPALTIDGATRSHAELDDLAGRVGGWLAAHGVGVGDRVLIVGATSHELVGAYLGTLRCGATALPADSAATGAELAQLLDSSPCVAAFVDADVVDRLGAVPGGNRPGLVVGLEPAGELIPFREAEGGDSIVPADGEGAAILAYTSGTTGRPKGVPLAHGNVLASIRGAMWAWRWSREDILVHALPLSHQHGLGGLHTALLSGSHTVILRRFDPERFCAAVREWRASVIMAVPTIYERLSEWEGIENAGMESLRLAVSGSAPLPPELARRVSEWLGQLPLERYGSTEAGLVLSNPYDGPRRPGFVGYPLPGIEVRVLGPEGDEVGAGEDGELVVRGPQVFSGYLDRPDATAEAFTPDGWFRSGDIAREDPDDGSFAITGRSKEMIISGGLNVFPREIEIVLDEHPAVQRSAVVGVPSERWGEEVVAFVVPAGGAQVDPDPLVAYCRERLSSFKCPKRVFAMSELPATEMGKVRRDELVSIAASENQSREKN